jgi:CheY-like chemotaxis protein
LTEKRAWVVERDSRVAGIIVGTLASHGYSVETFTGGQDALRACEGNGGADLAIVGAISDMDSCRLAIHLNLILRATILLPSDISHLADELAAIIKCLEEDPDMIIELDGWTIFACISCAT